MADKPSTTDTVKDFLSEIADSANKAYNELLDPPRKDKSKNSAFGEMLPFGHPLQAVAGLPTETLRAVGALAALGGSANPLAALGGSANPLAALTAAANPLAALAQPAAAGAAGNPLAALAGAIPGQLPALGGGTPANPLAALSGVGETVGGLAELPQQIARLTELVTTLLTALEAVQGIAGAVGGAVRAPAPRKSASS
ncbi:hypothetical protein [Streptomyces purpureus]|uniref:hypothetical protein n=1 Tax=Streptomyces purpureus TaxID=1951 RepID=UPI000360FB15|nr:hypothetical protein [Streptomyces purpureus]